MKNLSRLAAILGLATIVLAAVGVILLIIAPTAGMVFLVLTVITGAVYGVVFFKARKAAQDAATTKAAEDARIKKEKEDEERRTPPCNITDELILAYCYKNVPVVDIKQGNCSIGEWYEVGTDPSCPPNTFAIKKDNAIVGFINQDNVCNNISDYINKKKQYKFDILVIAEDAPLSTVSVAFYKQKDWVKKMRGKHFTLTGNKSEAVQSDLELVDVGEDVNIEFEDEKEKFVVTEVKSGAFLGYIKQNADMTEDETYRGCVYDNFVDDDGYYKIDIVIANL